MKISLHSLLFALILWMPTNSFAQTENSDSQAKRHSEKQALKEEALKKLKSNKQLKSAKTNKTTKSKGKLKRTVYTHAPNKREKKVKQPTINDPSTKMMRAKSHKRIYAEQPPTPPQSQIDKDVESLKTRISQIESLGVLDEKTHKQLKLFKNRLRQLEDQK